MVITGSLSVSKHQNWTAGCWLTDMKISIGLAAKNAESQIIDEITFTVGIFK